MISLDLFLDRNAKKYKNIRIFCISVEEKVKIDHNLAACDITLASVIFRGISICPKMGI